MIYDFNYLQETINALAANAKAPSDVLRVQRGDTVGTWDDFARLANKECNETSHATIIVGTDWWMQRDGDFEGIYEWWSFRTMPVKPTKAKPLSKIIIR